MNILAILLAAAAGFAMGAVWYGINGKRWMAAVGKTEEEIKASNSPLPFIIGGIASLLTATLVDHGFAKSGVEGWWDGAVGGFGIGAFIVAPWIVLNYAFADRPKALWWIDAGHVILALTAIGLVIGLFL